jgi:hypothetical protein
MTAEVVPFVQKSADESPAIEDLEDFFENGAVGLHLVGGDGTILRANGRTNYDGLRGPGVRRPKHQRLPC